MSSPFRCELCRFWKSWVQQPKAGEVRGECRRYAPALVGKPAEGNSGPFQRDQTKTRWPSTLSADFCGEFQLDDKKETG